MIDKKIAYWKMIFRLVWRDYKKAIFPSDKKRHREHCREIIRRLRGLKKLCK